MSSLGGSGLLDGNRTHPVKTPGQEDIEPPVKNRRGTEKFRVR